MWALASLRGGFSLCGARALGHPGFSSCGRAPRIQRCGPGHPGFSSCGTGHPGFSSCGWGTRGFSSCGPRAPGIQQLRHRARDSAAVAQGLWDSVSCNTELSSHGSQALVSVQAQWLWHMSLAGLSGSWYAGSSWIRMFSTFYTLAGKMLYH